MITTETALDMADNADEKSEPSDTELALSLLAEEVRGLRARITELEALVWPVQDNYARSAGYDESTDERLRDHGLDRLADALRALDRWWVQ